MFPFPAVGGTSVPSSCQHPPVPAQAVPWAGPSLRHAGSFVHPFPAAAPVIPPPESPSTVPAVQRSLCRRGPNHALQRTEAGGGVFPCTPRLASPASVAELEFVRRPRTSSMKHLAHFLLLAPVLFSVGCVPVHYTDRLGVDGTLVNSRTGAPVRSALVTVQDGAERASTTTGARGDFRIAPATHWTMYLMGDLHSPPASFSIEHRGFRSVHTQIHYNPLVSESATRSLGVIRMEPNPP